MIRNMMTNLVFQFETWFLCRNEKALYTRVKLFMLAGLKIRPIHVSRPTNVHTLRPTIILEEA